MVSIGTPKTLIAAVLAMHMTMGWCETQSSHPASDSTHTGSTRPAEVLVPVPVDPAEARSIPEHGEAAPAPHPSEEVLTPVEPTVTEKSAMEICREMQEEAGTTLEHVRRGLSITTCASSAWLDGLFGDQAHFEQYRETYGIISTGALWSEYDGFDPRLRFRVRLQLPQWNDRVSAFAGRVGQEDFVSDTETDFRALPTRQFGTLEDESVLVGLGYSNPRRTGNDFDASVGVRVNMPLDPYARVRYEIVRSFDDRYVLSARQSLFWQNSEGLGTTTRLTLDRPISDNLLLRWTNLGTYSQRSLGIEWYSQFTLFQSVGVRTGLAWQAQIEGASKNEVQITRTAARLIMRRQFRDPDWLFLELRSGVSWPRWKLTEIREASPEIGIALEMKFGAERKEPRL